MSQYDLTTLELKNKIRPAGYPLSSKKLFKMQILAKRGPASRFVVEANSKPL